MTLDGDEPGNWDGPGLMRSGGTQSDALADVGDRIGDRRPRALASGRRGRGGKCKVQTTTASYVIYAEDVMPRQRWSDLSERTRRLIIAAAVADATLRVAALIDIKRQPASQIRGPKQVWAAAVAIINSAGVLPISYFVFGRRRQP
jgi:hypothetical protein